ncbi:MAG: hypothetical protein ABIT47_01455 [Candidatus Paceibacterota bacterium]
MNTPLLLVREVVFRLAVAIISYFIIFSAYLYLFAAHAKHLLGNSDLIRISAMTLALPFIDLVRNPILLAHLLRAPKVSSDHTSHVEIVRIISIGIGMEILLFAVLIGVIAAFERSPKTRKSTLFFYATMPALMWLLWSQLYLFFG